MLAPARPIATINIRCRLSRSTTSRSLKHRSGPTNCSTPAAATPSTKRARFCPAGADVFQMQKASSHGRRTRRQKRRDPQGKVHRENICTRFAPAPHERAFCQAKQNKPGNRLAQGVSPAQKNRWSGNDSERKPSASDWLERGATRTACTRATIESQAGVLGFRAAANKKAVRKNGL